MNFDFALRIAFSQRRAALNEVSAAVAAAVGKGALDCGRQTRDYARVLSITSKSLEWRGSTAL